MTKQLVPSRALLSSISRSLQNNSQPLFSSQCQRRSLATLNKCAHAQSCVRLSSSGATKALERRQFTTSQSKLYKTVEEQRSRYRSGPFSWKAGVLFLAAGAGLIVYFRYEKARMERLRVAEAAKGVGRPKVGGPFQLTDQNGKPFSDADMKGKYSLVYFGFSHCPDICPEELDKMAIMIDSVNKAKAPSMPNLLPIFVTCDPARDTPAVLKEYLSEFHPDIVGLTGTWEQIKDICKKYRVYFSTPPNVKPGQDYLVDHSIYFYLMDPEGDFVEAIGRQHSPEQAAKIILEHVGDWKK
ncbi:Sco1 protein [Xylogone sp. PMI_703]|nr:Sco1 protein [Xylogone sp. PMI_703]